MPMFMIIFYKAMQYVIRAFHFIMEKRHLVAIILVALLATYLAFLFKRPAPVPQYNIEAVQTATETLQNKADAKIEGVVDNTRQRQEEGDRKIANVKGRNVNARELEEKLK